MQRIWNTGHMAGPSSKFSKMVGGKKRTISFHAMVFLAGVRQGVGRLLAAQQQSRTLRLDMQKYTEKTKPPYDYSIPEEVDEELFVKAYKLLRAWADQAKLNPKPKMPSGVIARDADNVRGLLAIAEDCGGDWPRRARAAVVALLEQQKREAPSITIRRHGLIIFETLELKEIKSTEFNKELRRLDLPDADWNRYRGPGGDEPAHPITLKEQAELLVEEDPPIASKLIRPLGKGRAGKPFRGLREEWFLEWAREQEPAASEAPRLRLITPQAE